MFLIMRKVKKQTKQKKNPAAPLKFHSFIALIFVEKSLEIIAFPIAGKS